MLLRVHRSPLLRPTLVPGLPRAWRSAHTLQLGHDPAHAVLIDLPDPRVAGLLDLLDGSRSERAVLAAAGDAGLALGDVRELLDTLYAAGLVLPAPGLVPSALTEDTRRRLTGEAAALALTRANALRATAFGATAFGATAFGATAFGATALGATAPVAAAREPADCRTPAEVPGRRPGGREPADCRTPAEIPSRRPGGREPADCRTPAQILRRRAGARVVVAGRGRLGAGIAVALAEAGVGHVHPDLTGVVTTGELAGGPLRAGDVGRPLAEAVAAAIGQAMPQTLTHAVRKPAPTLIVQLDHDRPAALVAAAHARGRQPHLAVTMRESAAVVGPFVPATGVPCLNCVDLFRRDRDSGWPQLSARPPGPEPGSVATVLAVTAYATAEALAFLDGRTPETLGAAVEIAAPGRARRRTWPPHPGCGCARRRRPDPTGLLAYDAAKTTNSGASPTKRRSQ
jgi:hypothetical protein